MGVWLCQETQRSNLCKVAAGAHVDLSRHAEEAGQIVEGVGTSVADAALLHNFWE